LCPFFKSAMSRSISAAGPVTVTWESKWFGIQKNEVIELWSVWTLKRKVIC
jgi:hypothetical protein